ncbi:hypothetical protein [Thiofilum flexile]|uniref:hypothetical protein n=1 Tax=Thiofilum flexile TaxID=125627 RepID=UPI00037208CA|nr:hypothetical protein [Thiofilum flexile]
MSDLHHFILVEGVNLYANIYDTDQLSVIRGSSFLYKDAIETIKESFKDHVVCISSGASSGLFLLKGGDAAQTVAAIKSKLTTPDSNQPFHLLTFMVVHTKANDLLAAKEQLYTQLRLGQLQSLTLQPDRETTGKGQFSTIPCGLSGSRIAASYEKTIQSDNKKTLSASIFQRWNYGRDSKKNYYAQQVNDTELQSWLDHFGFAEDIDTLCKVDAQKLNNKMAVVYLDGNGFSARQRKFLESAGGEVHQQITNQKAFDDTIQAQRKQFLTETLRYLLPKQWNDMIRLETLLWGGDEMLLVMPAWEGFDFLQRFFAFNWHLANGEIGGDTTLTHAAGIVFCQANTPIRIIQKLARELADGVKDISRKENGWDYLVLESVDYPTNESLSGYFKERYGEILAKCRKGLLPATPDWEQQKVELDDFLSGNAISRGQLYQIVQAIKLSYHPDKGEGAGESNSHSWAAVIRLEEKALLAHPQAQAEHRMFEVSEDKAFLQSSLPDKAKVWFGIEDFDNPQQRAWCWIHLLELWDYLIPRQNEKAQEGQ